MHTLQVAALVQLYLMLYCAGRYPRIPLRNTQATADRMAALDVDMVYHPDQRHGPHGRLHADAPGKLALGQAFSCAYPKTLLSEDPRHK